MAGVITFVFDDGAKSCYTKAFPYMQSKGIVGSIPIITGSLSGKYQDDYGSNLEPKDIQEMFDNGWEFVSHTHTHNAKLDYYEEPTRPEYEVGRANFELAESKRILESLGWGGNGLAYPGGGYNNGIIDIVKQNGISFARCSDVGLNALVPSDTDRFKLKSIWPQYTWAALDTATVAIDEAITNNQWVILSFHGIVDVDPGNYDVTTSIFNSIIDYAVASGAEIKTMSEQLNIPYTPSLIIPSYGNCDFKYWYIRDTFQTPAQWSRINWTDTQQESTIVRSGISCKINTVNIGDGIERVLADILPTDINISINVLNGKFKMQLVDYDRNIIDTTDINDILETTTLGEWQTLRKSVPGRDYKDTYIQIIATEQGSIAYVDDFTSTIPPSVISLTSRSIRINEVVNVSASILDGYGNEISTINSDYIWGVNDTAKATITNEGVLTAINTGVVCVTAIKGSLIGKLWIAIMSESAMYTHMIKMCITDNEKIMLPVYNVDNSGGGTDNTRLRFATVDGNKNFKLLDTPNAYGPILKIVTKQGVKTVKSYE